MLSLRRKFQIHYKLSPYLSAPIYYSVSFHENSLCIVSLLVRLPNSFFFVVLAPIAIDGMRSGVCMGSSRCGRASSRGVDYQIKKLISRGTFANDGLSMLGQGFLGDTARGFGSERIGVRNPENAEPGIKESKKRHFGSAPDPDT